MKKVALVTGGASGIGATVAEEFVSKNYHVIVYDVLGELEYKPIAGVEYVNGDVTDFSTVDQLFDYIANSYLRLDVLVCNAGILIEEEILSVTMHDFQRILNVNTVSVLYFMQKSAQMMIKSGFGRILVASSFASIIPSIKSGVYAASKLALDSLVRVMAAECGKYGITVNSYAPGMVPTNMSGIEQWDVDKKRRFLETLAIPYYGSPQDIANLLIFLASEKSSYITGSKIEITGGKFAVQFVQSI